MARKKSSESATDTLDEPSNVRVEPTPDKAPRAARGTGARGRKSHAAIQKELAEQFYAFLGVTAMIWSTRDDVCPNALAENSQELADGLAHFCAKSKYARKIATGMTDTSVLVPFSMAVVRFGSVVYSHHSGQPMPEPDHDVHGGFADHGNAPFDLTGHNV